MSFFENLQLGKMAAELMNYLVPFVAIPLLVRYVLPKILPVTQQAFDWVGTQAKHVDNQYAQGILTRLSNMVAAEVLAAENTLIEELKEAAADGKVTKEEMKDMLVQVKATVVSRVKEKMTAQGLFATASKLFLGETALTDWLEGMIETHVATLPPSGLQTSKDGTPPAIESGAVAPAEVPAPVPVPPSDPTPAAA